MSQIREYQVPVIIDVEATSIEQACATAVQALVDGQVTNREHEGSSVVSWWTVENVAKAADGNDNEDGVIVFENDLDYLYIVLQRAATGMKGVVPPGQRERHERLTRYFDKVENGGRCGAAGL